MAETNTFTLASGSLTAYWSRRMQRKYYKTGIFKALASMEEQKTLTKGQRVHRPYRSNLVVNDMGADGSYTRQALTDVDEYLDVDKKKEVTFNAVDYEKIQHNYNFVNEYADEAGERLGEQMDANYLAEIVNAYQDVDDADVSGGTADNGITVSESNVYKLFTVASKKLSKINVPMANRVAVLSPDVIEKLDEFKIARDTQDGDRTLTNGFTGVKVLGFDVYMSNALPFTTKLLMGTVPTAGDTVVINGVTFTFRDTGDVNSAGEVYYGLSAAAAVDNLVASINAPLTASSGIFYPVSAADALKLSNISAADGTTYLTITAKGAGSIDVSETLSATADVFTTALQIQHNYFGRRGATDMVVQKYPSMLMLPRSGYVSTDVVQWALYGLKTFTEGTKEIVDVKIAASTF